MDVYSSKVVLERALQSSKSWKPLLGKCRSKGFVIKKNSSMVFCRLMQEKDEKQRKGENLVDIAAKKKKRRCC